MRNTEAVHEVNSRGDLMENGARSCLWNNEFVLVQVAEKITASEQLHHNLDVILRLKDIKESDDAWVLAYF